MKKSTRQTALVLGLWLLFMSRPMIGAANRETYEEPFEKTLALARDGKVHISNVSGDIEIRTWGEGQVKIKAIKRSRASSLAEAKENAARVNIEIVEEGNVLRVETKYPRSDRFWGKHSVEVSVDYWLWIPEEASFKTKNVSGDIDVEATGGAADLSAVSGDILIRKARGPVECSAVSGDIEAVDVVGDVFLKSVSGDIKVNGAKGSVEAETVSGDVELIGIAEANKVRVKALSGEVVYRGSINPGGSYNLKSHSGSITLYLPANSAFDLEAETFSGSIRTDFEIKMTGKISPREISGVVHSGGATLRLSSFSGDIKLIKT